MCFARGDKEMAEKLCLEIIRQTPDACEPYITLSQIYEQDQANHEKYVELLTIAAYITNNSSRWQQLAEIMIEQENLKQANYYFGKALRCDPKNVEIRMQRLEVLKKMGKEKQYLRSLVSSLSHIPIQQHKLIIQNATLAAKKYYESGNIEKALDVMQIAYNLVPEHFQTEDVNGIAQLLINNQKYFEALEILKIKTGIKFNCKKIAQDSYEISNLTLPDNMNVNLIAKTCICLIKLNAPINELIENVCNLIDFGSNAELGELYLDIAETFMEKKNYKEALRLLNPLVESSSFSSAMVWMQHALCHEKIENIQQAIISYKKVVHLSQNSEARCRLGDLFTMQGNIEEAIEVLSQDLDEVEIICPITLKKKCHLLLQLERIDEYLSDAYIMLLGHCPHYRSRQEIEKSFSQTETNDRWKAVMSLRQIREEPVVEKYVIESDIIETEDWEFFRTAINTAFIYKRYTQLQRLIFAATASRQFQQHVKEIDFMAILSCIFNKEETFGYSKIRIFLKNNENCGRFWNLFNLVTYNLNDDCRCIRFLQRLFEKENNVNPMVYMLIANGHLGTGTSYKVAINCYDEIYSRYKSPLIALILGVLYMQVANQKFVNRKQSLILQSISFFESYANTRESEANMEILYNKGRFYHQIGMIATAKDFYHKALDTCSPLIEKDPEILDLRKTIAFNLHCIYKQAGNFHMARKILYENVVI